MSNFPSRAPRTFDVRTVSPAVWLLLGLAIVDVVFRIRAESSFDPLRVPALALVAAPFVFAAAVLYAAPADRRLVWGALALAVAEFLAVLSVFFQPPWLSIEVVSEGLGVIRRVGFLFTLAGLVLIGVALGGLRSRLALAVAAVGAVVFVLAQAWYTSRLLDPSSDLTLPPDQLIVTFVGPLVTVGWAFLAAAGFERGLRLIPLGAALLVALAALSTVLLVLSRADPFADFSFLLVPYTLVGLAAWAALVAGALTELRRAPAPTDVPASPEETAGAERAAS